jgi:ubiquinone/menaquinone biosynthesis C-methylase UbiE
MQAVNNSIKSRYAEQSTANCSLSCGNNLNYLGLKNGERVLDLGCGAGHETIEVAILVGDQGEAVGLDLTTEMLTVARQNAITRGLSNAFFVSGSIEYLPFSNNIFDVIISNCVINHASDKEQVYREIFRVLKSGGRFVVSDAVTKENLPEHIKNDPAQWAACFGGAITEANYLQCIREAGFANINILSRREYQKNDYDFASLTIQAIKP